MTESNDQADKTLRAGGRKPMSLQRTVESGHVRQNFSHGRSKSVVVEKKKTRKLGGPGGDAVIEAAPATQVFEKPKAPVTTARAASSEPQAAAEARNAAQQRNLSTEERDARARALAAARAEEPARPADGESVRFEPAHAAETVAKADEPKAAPAAATPATSVPLRPAPRRDDAAARDAGAPQQRDGGRPPTQRTGPRPGGTNSYMPREAGRPREIEFPGPRRGAAPAAPDPTLEKPTRLQRPVIAKQQQVSDEDDRGKRGPGGVKITRPAVKEPVDSRQRTKISITNFDREAQQRSLASLKRKREKEKQKALGLPLVREKIARDVIIPEVITIQ